jgi:hypothetical protein
MGCFSLIPQAFTTRDMSDAYKWLQSLPTSVREEMKSMEQVVALYLRAKRLGGAVPTKEDVDNHVTPSQETSKSSQDFQKSLKSLRHELDQFDFAPSAQAPTNSHAESNGVQAPSPKAPFAAPPKQGVQEMDSISHPHTPMPTAMRLDPRSRQLMNDIHEGLNLSSDVEVIRMSLVLAHKALVGLLK